MRLLSLLEMFGSANLLASAKQGDYVFTITAGAENDLGGRRAGTEWIEWGGEKVMAGYWMDFPEPGERKGYYSKPIAERAQLEANTQTSKYDMARDFEHHRFATSVTGGFNTQAHVDYLIKRGGELMSLGVNEEDLFSRYFGWSPENVNAAVKTILRQQ